MRQIYPPSNKAFSLLELVILLVILAIIAVIAIPVFNSVLQQSRFTVTYQNMAEIERAIIGDPSTDFLGFRQVMRANPNPLSQLWDGSAASAVNPYTGQGTDGVFTQPSSGQDGWSQTFDWDHTTSVLTSGGPDQDTGTAGDNIVKVIGED